MSAAMIKKFVLTIGILASTPVLAVDVEDAKNLMEQGQYEQAYQMLYPMAQTGNAEAEELIGSMYALGTGVERDDIRAFEWYLRASLRGHPGAQSGIGWYYEVGRGMPAPDLVRGYAWYTLSAIGGDPDAAISLEEIVKKMTPEQIEQSLILVKDYRAHIYPFQ
jgi:TPR repeat protein